jgi:peptidoglycan/LPS O-acetylase OafA/YrhL
VLRIRRFNSGPEAARLGQRDNSPPGGGDFRADIQGLRAVAVLLVVLSHAGVHRLQGGYVGVDVWSWS